LDGNPYCSYFKRGDKDDPSNYKTIMTTPLLEKLYGLKLEKKISLWLETRDKKDKGNIGF
jgi:hypothetical protein